MRVAVQADATAVAYVCRVCRARLTLSSAAFGQSGKLFLAEHRGCEEPGDVPSDPDGPARAATG
jgi:hypothetical protein